MTYYTEENYNESAQFLRSKLPKEFHNIQLGIICGTGLNGLAESIEQETKIEFDYNDIPNFTNTTVSGHDGKLVFGYLGKFRTPTVLMVGRCHFYEGYTMNECTLPVRVMILLGIKYLIVTNACGGLQSEHKVEDIVILYDHIFIPGMAGNNPLVGNNVDAFGPRFPIISDVYEYSLRKLAFKAAYDTNILKDDIHEGVYCMLTGPYFETPAEARYIKSVGADVVGMSTLPEVVVASHAGIKVLGISLVTVNVYREKEKEKSAKLDVLNELQNSCNSNQHNKEINIVNHEEILEASGKRIDDLKKMIGRFADLLNVHTTKSLSKL